MADRPSGTVTFLFTDIEGSTALARAHPAEWESARQRHHAILRAACEVHAGHVFQIVGDAFCVAFTTAPEALASAMEAQRALHAEAWGETPVKVRMGVHTGPAEARDGDYHGYLTLAHVQRVMSVAHGGQLLVSNATAALLAGQLPDGVTLRDLGEHRLKSLLDPEHLWQAVASNLQQDFPPLASLNTIPNNLPIQVTSFVGRERELSELRQLLPTTRLLTLTGSGGTGKTRLSLELAAALLDPSPGLEQAYRDGVWFIELAPLSDPALVRVTIASMLGVREEHGRPLLATLLDWLRPKRLLFILDNCEHLIETCATLADAVLHASRDIRIVASSREALGIAGELAWRVPSLDMPNAGGPIPAAALAQYAAIRLFVERASFANAAFRLTDANAPSITQICSRLDGIPLAIELAAARVKLLPPEQIASRLDDRFRLLTGGSRTALPRQQTLRSLIDWSHNLLSEPERVLLRRLAVFAGGWTLEAAQTVCAGDDLDEYELIDLLSHLVDKSLIVAEEQSGSARYRMLETIRQYSREKLLDAGESERLRDQHLHFCVQLAERTEPILLTPERTVWLPRLELEHDNLRAALEWACQRDVETARWLAGILYWFWRFDDHLGEAHTWYARVLAAGPRETATKGLAAALFGLGITLYNQGSDDAALTVLEESATCWRKFSDDGRLAWALFVTAHSLTYRGDGARACAIFAGHESLFRTSADEVLLVWTLSTWGLAQAMLWRDDPVAKTRFGEALSLARPLQDPHSLFICYMCLGEWALLQSDYAAAHRHFLEALRWRRRLGTRWMIVIGLRQAAETMCLLRDYLQAEPLFTEALALTRALGDQRGEANMTLGLASVALNLGDLERAKTLLAPSIRSFQKFADAWGLSVGLRVFADLRQVQGQAEQAAVLLGVVETAIQSRQIHFAAYHRLMYERSVAAARAQLDPAVFSAAWEVGKGLTMEQAIALAFGDDAAQPVARN